MHKHDIKPEEGIPYCEYLLASKQELERRLEILDGYEKRRRELLELIELLPSPEEEPGAIVAELPMTDSDVKRAVSRRWRHADGSPLDAEEEAERDRELFAALTNLRYSRAMHAELEDLNAGVARARLQLADWRRYFNMAVGLQAKHLAANGGAPETTPAARRSRRRRTSKR
jgi:hypothetical protein